LISKESKNTNLEKKNMGQIYLLIVWSIRMKSGKWKVESEKWKVKSGKWKMKSEKLKLKI